MMDFYQVFTYTPSNGMAAPIKEGGKPVVYYDILEMFNYQVCEYIPKDEIEFKKLEAWGSFKPNFSSADQVKLNSAKANGDTPSVSESNDRKSIYVYDGDSLKIADNTGHVHTYNRPIGLDVTELKGLGYKNIIITMDVQIRAHDKGDGRAIWLDIDNSQVWKKSNLKVDWTSWERRTYTQTVDIKTLKDTSVFRFGFENTSTDFWTDKIWWFNEATVTFRAVK